MCEKEREFVCMCACVYVCVCNDCCVNPQIVFCILARVLSLNLGVLPPAIGERVGREGHCAAIHVQPDALNPFRAKMRWNFIVAINHPRIIQ